MASRFTGPTHSYRSTLIASMPETPPALYELVVESLDGDGLNVGPEGKW
jgi:hypothetical protein